MSEKDYVLAMVFSNWALSKILDFFKDYLDGKSEDIGLTKIERFKDKRTAEMRDSNRTVILIKKDLFKKAIDAGLDMPQPNLDFRIAEYILKEKSFPAVNYSSNLFLIIPKNINYLEAEMAIKEKINILVNFNVLNLEDYSLKIPLVSRTTGEHRGYAYLSFQNNVELATKAYIKILLCDCLLYAPSLDKLYHVPVFWAKESNRPKLISDIPSQTVTKITQILKRDF